MPDRPLPRLNPSPIDLTMAFVGTLAMFEKAGFTVAGTTEASASKLPRLVMRRMLLRQSSI